MGERRPVYPIHPGEVLADELAELNMTASELARTLHVPANRLYQLIAGKRSITADTALRLERRHGVSARFWMNLQNSYELDVVSEKFRNEIENTIEPRVPAA